MNLSCHSGHSGLFRVVVACRSEVHLVVVGAAIAVVAAAVRLEN